MFHGHLRTLGLADALEELAEPRQVDVERLAALDAREFDRAEDIVLILVVADHAAFAAQRALDGEIRAALDEAQVVDVGGGGAGEVTALLDEGLFRTEHLGFCCRLGAAGYERRPHSDRLYDTGSRC